MEIVKRDPRGQGERGEQVAALWFTSHSATVFILFFHSPCDYDFIVDCDDGVKRVQVKTSIYFHNGRWGMTLCTRGGNRSWSALVKRLDPGRYDLLSVVVGDGRRWLIPSADLPGGSGLNLGGPNYSDYEIERGEPLLSQGRTLDSAALRRDTRAVKGTRL